jgi:hypothetical protein
MAWDVSFHDIPRSSSVSSDDQSHFFYPLLQSTKMAAVMEATEWATPTWITSLNFVVIRLVVGTQETVSETLHFCKFCDEEWVLTWILHLWPEDYPNYGCKMILLWSIMNLCARSSASQMLTIAFHLFLSFLDGGSGGYGGYGGYGRGYY